MEKYHQTTPHRVQAIRLFSVIQQLNNSQTPTLNAYSLDKLLKTIGLQNHQDLIKFMHSIDKQNKQMRNEYWGYCLSLALQKIKLTCQSDYINLHSHIKSLLIGTYIPPLQNYQLWDGQYMKTNVQKDEQYARILNNCSEISLQIHKIDFLTFNKIIVNINCCFSLINLFPNKESQILQIYQKILGGSFLQTLEFALTMNAPQNILLEMIKCLCYLYQSFKYQKIRKILQVSFLVNPATFTGLIQTINDKRPQVRYYTCAMMAIMANTVQALPFVILNNKQILYSISNGIAQIRQKQGLVYGIQFMMGIVRGFAELSQQQKVENVSVINVYLNFVVGKLGELQSEKSQAVCIQLVVEVVKVMDFSQDYLKLLKFIDTVFQGPNQIKFQPLFQVTLDIVKYAIIYKRENVQKYIMDNKSFQTYLRNTLKTNHQQWQPFYSALQTVLLIASSPTTCDTLFKRDLIQSIFQLSSTQNQAVLLYVSQIVLSLILNSLDSEWKITYLHQKCCMKCIGELMYNCSGVDVVLEREYRVGDVSFRNRQAMVNAVKALHYLNFQAGNLSSLKKQHYIKNFSLFFIKSFSQSLVTLFTSIKNYQYLSYLLKQQHSLSRNINTHEPPFQKLYKLLSTVIQQMTYNLRKRNTPLQILKLVHHIRSQLHRYLYALLSYNQLVVQSIPIYLGYQISFNGKNVRQVASRLSWNQIRAMLYEIVKKQIGIQCQSYNIIDKETKRQIRNEDDYRKILDGILSNYNRTKFIVDLELANIRQRQDIRDKFRTSPSLRGDGLFPRNDIVPHFGSTRMPTGRQHSPFRSWKDSPRKNTSPSFATYCRECNKTTTNKSQICNACVQNRFK